jgi:parvulin-like peptidyl-prolyl isomerase
MEQTVMEQTVMEQAVMKQVDLLGLARCRLLRPYLRQVVLDEVLADISLDADETETARQQFLQENGIDSEERLSHYCQHYGLSRADLDDQIAYPLRVEKYGRRQFGARAESHFLARKSHLDQVVYSLLRSKDAGLIRELYLQVREGEANFADLAAEHAEGPERATRGIVGPVSLSQGHPDLVDRLASAQPGLVLEPFQIEDWWVLIRLERYAPAIYGPEAADAMIQELLEHWLEDQVNLRIQALRPLNITSQG